MVFDLAVSRRWLTGTCFRVLIPIMISAMSDKNCAVCLDLANEIDALYANCNSATLRTPGMFPLFSS